jgi:hypothetical protein
MNNNLFNIVEIFKMFENKHFSNLHYYDKEFLILTDEEDIMKLYYFLTDLIIRHGGKYLYGFKYYRHGDIVVWRGNNPAILRVYSQTKDGNIYCGNHYGGLSISNVRYATPKEIKKLGNKVFLPIKLRKRKRAD